MIHEYCEKVVAMTIQSSLKRLLNSDSLVWMDNNKQASKILMPVIIAGQVNHVVLLLM